MERSRRRKQSGDGQRHRRRHVLPSSNSGHRRTEQARLLPACARDGWRQGRRGAAVCPFLLGCSVVPSLRPPRARSQLRPADNTQRPVSVCVCPCACAGVYVHPLMFSVTVPHSSNTPQSQSFRSGKAKKDGRYFSASLPNLTVRWRHGSSSSSSRDDGGSHRQRPCARDQAGRAPSEPPGTRMTRNISASNIRDVMLEGSISQKKGT
ncbi:hypothetical protein SORBI_3004G083250 [Sorghum bicolor]|uniref:Uncharacterized protein n=1 Tax=Sorghum bicolor TaxID=4558 RepID=A0A1Z5RLN5_SORBI|nr:hypothetical protein SORBI_3004G083250 [Sorghum bicolor]